MATAIVKREIFDCSICLEQFNIPKCLPCYHTFCKSCLETYISSETSKESNEASKVKSFPCPICRKHVEQLDSNLSVEQWVKDMPTNSFITSLLDNISWVDGSSTRMCDACKFSGDEIQAVSWCKDCSESLCDACSKCHRKSKATRKHKIVPIEDIKDDSFRLTEIDEPCMQHKGKHLEVYCVDHDEMCCVVCVSADHRLCPNIKTIEVVSEQTSNKQTKDFTKQLKEVETLVGCFSDKNQKNLEKLDKKHDDILTSVTENAVSAKAKIDEMLDKFKCDFKNHHIEKRDLWIEQKAKIDSFRKTIANGCKLVEAVSDKGNVKQVFIAMAKVRSQLRSHMSQLCSELVDDCTVGYEFTLNKTIAKITNINDIAIIETVQSPCNADPVEGIILSVKSCCTTSETEEEDQSNADQNDVISQAQVEAIPLDNIEVIEAVPICEIKSIGSDFTGGVFLADDNIMFADRCSEKLKIYSLTGKCIKSYHLDKPPYDLALGLNGEIYVTFYESCLIRQYRVEENNLVKVDELKSDVPTCGIVITPRGILLSSKEKVSLVSENDGSIIKSFPRSSDDYTYTCVSKFGHFYYNNHNELICSGLDGNKSFCHKNEKLKNAKGIGLDCSENVYVCCERGIQWYKWKVVIG